MIKLNINIFAILSSIREVTLTLGKYFSNLVTVNKHCDNLTVQVTQKMSLSLNNRNTSVIKHLYHI